MKAVAATKVMTVESVAHFRRLDPDHVVPGQVCA